MHLEPFTIRVPDEVLSDLRTRIRNTRWPDQAPGPAWAQGTDLEYLKRLLGYWADGFDWRAQERQLNTFRHFRAELGDIHVHFVHERAREGNGIPLILTHGWPSSFLELLPLVPLLTDPKANGIDGPAFDLVIPSLPGYGFSERPAQANYRTVARLWHELMHGLGYERYGAGGGDFGSGVDHVDGHRESGAHDRHPPDHDGIRSLAADRRGDAPVDRSRTRLCCPGAPMGRGRAGLFRHPVDETPDARLCVERFACRARGLDPREVACVERLRRRPRGSLFAGVSPHDADALLGHGDDHPFDARLFR